MRKKGFTLVELLVVISIIAMLLAILLPSLNKAREQASASVCKSRHKQMITAITLYTVDNEGRFPTNYLDAELRKAQGYGGDFRYFALVAKYVGSKSVGDRNVGSSLKGGASDNYLFRCTTQDYITAGLTTSANMDDFKSPKTGITYHGVGTQLGIYGYNRFFRGQPKDDPYSNPSQWKTTNVKNSSSLPILSCSNVELKHAPMADYDGITSGAGGEMRVSYPNPIAIDYGWPKVNRGQQKIQWFGPAAIHNGKMTYSMADGSVRTFTDLWPFDKSDTSKDFSIYFHPQGKGIR